MSVNYSPALLKELSKIIFLKCTTEQTQIEHYVKLCNSLFRKYKSTEDKEMNFKKLLLTKCQKEFYRNKTEEDEEAKAREQALADGVEYVPKTIYKDEDLNEATYKVLDESQIKQIGKTKVFGNIKLIGELFCLG